MTAKKITIITFWFLVAIMKISAGQEPLTINTRFSNLSRNPALAGIQIEDLSIGVSYRHQVKSILVPYRILQVQIESRFNHQDAKDGFTAGSIIRYEEAGENNLKRAQFIPVLNFHKSLSDIKISYLNMGFMIGIYKSQFDVNVLPNFQNFHPIPFDPTHPVEQSILANSNSYIDFSTGISWFSEIDQGISFYLGAALFHFCPNSLKILQTAPRTPRVWVINSGLNYSSQKYTLQILADLRLDKNERNFNALLMGGIVMQRNYYNQSSEIQIGLQFKSDKEFYPLIALKLPSVFVSICCNLISKEKNNIPIIQNTFESNLSININCHKRKPESEKLKCFN